MASIIISNYNSPQFLFPTNPNSPFSSSSSSSSSSAVLHYPPYRTYLNLQHRTHLRTGYAGGKIGCEDETCGPETLRKPIISPVEEVVKKGSFELSSDDKNEDRRVGKRDEDEWVDWEDQILEDTVPLVGFVRMILHSGKYQGGDRLTTEHEKAIVERLLPYHPECEKKIGSGIDYIKVGYHQEFESSRCLFIVRKDGESVDFSYWKCVKGLIRKNYPLYADSFIHRHIRQPKRRE